MQDILLIGLIILFFALCFLLIHFYDSLSRSE